jgi:hypothetical protein
MSVLYLWGGVLVFGSLVGNAFMKEYTLPQKGSNSMKKDGGFGIA